ncbi:hypothetical protein [Roseiconus nitratireducens]|uniref:hypothetical protein n=1 Tax=Roseiconus nitratireducens TaxID=2605748 RepID=UPI0013754FA6|nr:hypothetical protein [Roseiconus nitratireducens]
MLRQRGEILKDRLDAVPVRARGALIAIALGLIATGILYLASGRTTDPTEPLFGGRALSELELDQVQLAFGEAGLNGWRREDGQILIPTGTRAEYYAALQQFTALPYALRSRVDDAFAAGGYFESDADKRARHQYAKAQDLGHKIAAFADIRWASVDYDEQVVGGFSREVLRTASVIVEPENGEPVSPARIQMIQEMVRGSYAGMSAEDVVVTDTSARDTCNIADDPAWKRRRQAEYELEQKIRHLLSGFGTLQIAVNCVDPDPQGPIGPDSPTDPVDDSGPSEQADISTRAANRSTDGPGAVIPMRVSIGVPDSHVHTRWTRQSVSTTRGADATAPPTKEQLQQMEQDLFAHIRDAVRPLLPGPTTSDRADRIQVWTYPDPDRAVPQYSGNAFTWRLPRWPELLQDNAALVFPLAGLLLVSLIALTAAVRMRLRVSRVPVASTAEDEEPLSGSAKEHPVVAAQQDATLRDELAELVEANPELAAQIIHGWIADAA